MRAKGSPGLMAVIRVRGLPNVRSDIAALLDMLNLKRRFRATLVPSTPPYMGALKKARDYITYGEIEEETLLLLLMKRGELKVGGKLTDEWLVKHTEFHDVKELAKSIHNGKAELPELTWLKPYFKLHPPTKGFKRTTKRAWSDGGELGHRGEAMDELLRRMM